MLRRCYCAQFFAPPSKWMSQSRTKKAFHLDGERSLRALLLSTSFMNAPSVPPTTLSMSAVPACISYHFSHFFALIVRADFFLFFSFPLARCVRSATTRTIFLRNINAAGRVSCIIYSIVIFIALFTLSLSMRRLLIFSLSLTLYHIWRVCTDRTFAWREHPRVTLQIICGVNFNQGLAGSLVKSGARD